MYKNNPVGVIGHPKYKYDEIISFEIEGKIKTGKVYVIDSYGTFEQHIEPSYDILVEEERTLYKHIRESWTVHIDEA